MSNYDSPSTAENPRSLRSLFLDLKGDLKSKSDSSLKVRKKFEECVGSTSDISVPSNSNFDDELSLFLKNTGKEGNLLDLLNKKYLIGYAISEAFSGTDLDAYTLFHLWNTKRTSHQSIASLSQGSSSHDETLETGKVSESVLRDSFMVFFQQMFYSWQSQLESIVRTRPIFKIPPQDNSLVHCIEPKTICLILLTYLYGINSIKFVGLRNNPTRSSVPGPYLSLLNLDSKADFLTCVNRIYDLVFKKDSSSTEIFVPLNSYYSDFDGYLNISYFVYQLDLIYSYILLDEKCYKNYTEPILLKTFTSWTYGKFSLFLRSFSLRSTLGNLTTSEVLTRLDDILSLICKIFSDFKNTSHQVSLDKFIPRNFNIFCFICVVYSYLYAILSIPLELLPWENFVFDKLLPPDDLSDTQHSDSAVENEEKNTEFPNETNTNYEYGEERGQENYNIINMSVHNEFAETASDSTCIENTRRHDNLMTHVIGLVNGEGNWIKKKEKFVDVIDTYKLGLSWYRRPTFSNTLYNTSCKAWPIALYYYNLLIEPVGRASFVWYWKNTEAWSSSDVWSYQPRQYSPKGKGILQFLRRITQKRHRSTDSNLQLKRQVSLRLRDTVSYIFDMELELKRGLLYSHPQNRRVF